MAKEEIVFEGSIEKIIFHNKDNAYTVFVLETSDGELTCVGTLPYVRKGENIKIKGEFTEHPTFGQQFQLSYFEKIAPVTAEAIYKYLASGAVKGVGKVTAKKLVDAFGCETLNVLENQVEKIYSIDGMSKKKADKISEEYKKLSGMQEIVIALTQYGLNLNQAAKVFKEWGNNSREILSMDPYSLCAEPFEFGFDKAEEVAAKLKFESNSKSRIRAGIIHILQHNQLNGHTCLPKDKLTTVTSKFLNVENTLIEDVLQDMAQGNILKICNFGDREFVFTTSSYECETYIASRISMMLKYPPQVISDIDCDIETIETTQNIQYDAIQKEAVKTALDRGLLILTGGPGTGKTTTLNAIIELLGMHGEKVLLCAPTGRAAQRMKELTKRDAKTIHRLLDVSWGTNDKLVFGKNERNPLKCDALVLDELSMVDAYLFAALLRALPLGCRLILVGDSNQLPCIGPGNILTDLSESGVAPVIKLKKIFRQSSESLIITNAHKIVSGDMPELQVRDKDFFFMKNNDAQNIQDKIVGLCSKRLKNTYGFDDFDIQVLTPSKKNQLGTMQLNMKLQSTINPISYQKKEISINGTIFRQGDKVMQIKNDYDVVYDKNDGSTGYGIFNGDIGTLENINVDSQTLSVCFEDKTAYYSFEQALNLDLAYAITVHKSQGSEFEAVIIPVFSVSSLLCYRNLLYTAVTRAKKMVILIGNIETIKKMVDNNKKMNRYTGLSWFLDGEE